MSSNRLPITDTTIDAVLILWSRGLNTYEIAYQWFVIEADVCRALSIGRDRVLTRRSATR